jgi:WD40 repeat protein
VSSSPVNPFRALMSFTRKDSHVLFGREGDLTLMVDRLMGRRATLLFAGSGVGKTSFLEAKLVPEIEDQYFICVHKEWAALKPLEAVTASLEKALAQSWWRAGAPAPVGTTQKQASLLEFYSRPDLFARVPPCGSVLVLDQFEEVFQYHKDTDYFGVFIDQLAEVINASAPEIRLLFSMREEFLGELSVFDNKIPDLFNNYYRLKNPSKRQARDIIVGTVRSVLVEPSDSLSSLIADLLAVHTTYNIGPQPPGEPTKHVLRNYVPPPYLQIACYRLWRNVMAKNGDRRVFPEDYQPGNALRELEAYCRENLDAIGEEQKNLVCDALGFLMTSKGAKMAYELSNLAQHMGAPTEILRPALEQLSQPEVRILREFSAPDGSSWFELYHDMYAPFLSAWKLEFQKARDEKRTAEEEKRERQRLEAEEQVEEEKRQRDDAEKRAAEEKRQRDEAERAFAEERSRRAEEKARAAKILLEEKARSARRLKFLSIGLAIAFLLAVTGLYFAVHYAKLARSRELSADAMQNLGTDPELGVLLSLQALQLATTTEAENSLHNTVEGTLPLLSFVLPDGDKATKDPVRTVAYSPDGVRIATAGDDRIARIWNASSGQLLLTLKGHTDRIWSLAFSPDGKRLVTGSLDSTAKVWDANNGTALRTLSGHRDMILSVAFSPNGKLVATASADHTAMLWDVDLGQRDTGGRNVTAPLQELRGHSNFVYAVAFSPDGKFLATGSADHTAKIWQVDSGKELGTFGGSKQDDNDIEVRSVCFSPDGQRLATAGTDGAVRIWNAAMRSSLVLGGIPLLKVFTNFTSAPGTRRPALNSVAFSPNSDMVAAGSDDGTVQIWEASTGELQLTLPGHAGGTNSVVFAPHRRILASAGSDGLINLWSLSLGGEVFSADDSPNAIAFSPDGMHIATGGNGSTAHLRATTGDDLHVLVGHSEPVMDVAFAPDGKRLVTASLDNTVKIWDVASGAMLQSFDGPPKNSGGFLSVAFSNQGVIAAGTASGSVILWNKDGQNAGALNSPDSVKTNSDGRVPNRVWAVAFRQDGKELAAAYGDTTARIWDIDSKRKLQELWGHRGEVLGITFSPDGKYVATASRDNSAKLWDVVTGKEKKTYNGHTDAVSAVAFTPNGQHLATSGHDYTIRLWGTASGVEELTLSSPSQVAKVAVSPNGKHLGTANLDGALRVYTIDSSELTAIATNKISRALTDQECKKYLHARVACSETSAPALVLLERADRLARNGDLATASTSFQQAQKESGYFGFNPEIRAKQVRVAVLLDEARNLAADGDQSGTSQAVRQALSLDSELQIDPDRYAQSLISQGLLEEGRALAKSGRLVEAMKDYDNAQKVDPNLRVDATSLNVLCWWGSLWGHASDVIAKCREAVQLAPHDSNIGDSLGVALTITGSPQDAIPYFEKFALDPNSNKTHAARRKTWLPLLKRGENPVNDPAEIEWLRVN